MMKSDEVLTFAQPEHHRFFFGSDGSPRLGCFSPQSSHMRVVRLRCSAVVTAPARSSALKPFRT
jgi:hypothetical protein